MLELKIMKTKLSKRGYIILFSIFIALFILTIALVVINLNQTKIFTIKEDTYQYYFGQKFSFPANSKLVITEDNETILKFDNQNSCLDATPIFFTSKNGIILPKTVEYVNVNNNQIKSVSFFSEVLKTQENISIHKNGSKVNINSGFLFDGNDIYIFLEPFTAKIGNEEINIEPFSYAEILYNQAISIYLKDKDEYIMTDYNGEDFMAKAKSGYSINLNTDVLINSDGTEQLLFSKPELLKPII